MLLASPYSKSSSFSPRLHALIKHHHSLSQSHLTHHSRHNIMGPRSAQKLTRMRLLHMKRIKLRFRYYMCRPCCRALQASEFTRCTRTTSNAETTMRTGGTCQTCRYHLQLSSSVEFRHAMCCQRMAFNLTHLLLIRRQMKEKVQTTPAIQVCSRVESECTGI